MDQHDQPSAPETRPSGKAWLSQFRPALVIEWEARLGRSIKLPLWVLDAAKAGVLIPLLFLALYPEDPWVKDWPGLIIGLFTAMVGLDYLIEVAARERGAEPGFGRLFDRLTDYPLLLVVAWFSLSVLPPYLVGMKVAVDLALLALYLLRRGSPKNRLRSAVHYAALVAMLFVYQGWGSSLLTPELASYIVIANIVYGSLVVLYNLKVIQKRFIADALSAANLMCGVFSMVFASRGRFDVSLVFLMLGAAFDGFDGAAARKWGGTSWGVYSDDVADAVNYGVAPGVALYFGLAGVQGAVIGAFYIIFTLSRLVFFTLNKSASDPNYFSGTPSTMGGLITLSSLVLFKDQPALTGMMVGVVCALMVSFDTLHRHLGRALSEHRRAFFGMPVLIVALLMGVKYFGVKAPVALVLAASLAYAFKPTIGHLVRVMKKSVPEKPCP